MRLSKLVLSEDSNQSDHNSVKKVVLRAYFGAIEFMKKKKQKFMQSFQFTCYNCFTKRNILSVKKTLLIRTNEKFESFCKLFSFLC